MSILFRWQLQALVSRLLLTQSALLAVFFVIEAFDKSRLLGHGMTGSILVEYIVLKTPMMIAEFMPITLLIAAAIHLIGLSRHQELVVMRAAGLGVGSVLLPLLAGSLLAAGVVLLFEQWVLPATNVRLNQIERVNVHGGKPITEQKVQWYRSGHRFFRVAPLDGEWVSLLVLDVDGQGNWQRRVDSKRARYRDGAWQMHEVTISRPDASRGMVVTQQALMRLPAPQGAIGGHKPWPNEMGVIKLYRFANHLRSSGLEDESYRYALYRQLAQPFACLVMALLAIAFCAQVGGRSASGYGGMVAALVLGLLLYITGNASGMLIGGGGLPPGFAAWLPNMVFGGLAVFLLLHKEGY
ncbi:MAG: LptF/LptG family permease [Mariprofundales bacterium]|nr:LptF/LptG family permease [Mariprofundales bacterium]